jgi:hypothetical protein
MEERSTIQEEKVQEEESSRMFEGSVMVCFSSSRAG